VPADVAHDVFTQAYERFAIANDDPYQRRRVRMNTARRWVTSAAQLTRAGRRADAARHMAYAATWHPLGVVTGIAAGSCTSARRAILSRSAAA
jgi:hypothetical protein